MKRSGVGEEVDGGAGLLEEEEIVSRAEPYPDEERYCVYFLVHRGRVVYVGSSMGLWSRLRAHAIHGSRVFSSIYVEWCSSEEVALERERKYLQELDPPFNSRGTTTGKKRPTQIGEEFWND